MSELHHVWCEPQHKFFQRIDECGGWPVGMKYVSFAHSDKRECQFGNEYLRTGWWTTIADSDEYFLWKLSDEAKRKLKAELKRQLIIMLSNMELKP
jgi:hypothetical protein